MVGACYFFSRPALSKKKQAEVARVISRSRSFFVTKRTTLDRRSFSAALADDMAELRLTPRERELVFSTIDGDGTGTITKEELDAYTVEYQNPGRKGGRLSQALKRFRSSVEEQQDIQESVQEQRDIIDEYAENLPNVRVPSLKLRDFPGIELPASVPPVLRDLQLPEVRLGALPGLDMYDLLRQNLPLEGIQLPAMNLVDFPGIQLPEGFVHMQLRGFPP